MNKKIKSFIPTIAIVFFSIALYHIFNNFSGFSKVMKSAWDVVSPIWIGFVIFYLLNIPMKIFEKNVFKKIKSASAKRSLSVVATLLLVVAFLSFVGFVIVPSLTANIVTLSSQVQDLINSAVSFYDKLPVYIKNISGFEVDIDSIIASFYKSFSNFMTMFMDSVGGYFSSVVSGVYTTFMALALSIYMLFGKERISSAIATFFDAYGSKKVMDNIRRYLKVIDKSFEVFIRGQMFEGLILGVISYVFMLLFKFPYALLISFLIGVTNVIPIIGPYLGAIPSFFLLLAVNPTKAFLFIPYVIGLQQLEGNVIYPRIVGDAMGISGFWIMVVVIVGNGFFGVSGILIGIPLFAAVYTLLKEDIASRAIPKVKITDIVVDEEAVEQ